LSNCSFQDVVEVFNQGGQSEKLDKIEKLDEFVIQHNIKTKLEENRVHFGFALSYDKKVEKTAFFAHFSGIIMFVKFTNR
jgi:hypothetical protein